MAAFSRTITYENNAYEVTATFSWDDDEHAPTVELQSITLRFGREEEWPGSIAIEPRLEYALIDDFEELLLQERADEIEAARP